MFANRFAQQTLNYIWTHPNCQNNRLGAIARFFGWQLYKCLTHKSLDISLLTPIKIRCYPNSAAASAVLYCGLYDFDEMHFLLRYLRPEDDFLDIGANVGVYTLLAATQIKSGTIYSIEALPKNYQRLQENIALNDLQNVRAYGIAIADFVGTATLDLAEGDCLPHLTNASPTTTGISVPCQTLDNLFANQSIANLKLAKMDIEGAECLALEGAKTLLERQLPPVWIVEVVFQDSEFAQFWQKYGYRFYHYDARKNSLESAKLAEIANKNILAIAEKAVEEVRDRLKNSGS